MARQHAVPFTDEELDREYQHYMSDSDYQPPEDIQPDEWPSTDSGNGHKHLTVASIHKCQDPRCVSAYLARLDAQGGAN